MTDMQQQPSLDRSMSVTGEAQPCSCTLVVVVGTSNCSGRVLGTPAVPAGLRPVNDDQQLSSTIPNQAPKRHFHAVRRSHFIHKTLSLALSLSCLTLMIGCVTEGRPAKPLPSSSIPSQPEGLTVNRVVITVAQVLEDRDRNGYYDTIPATVYLFDSPRYAYSITRPGVFEFQLSSVDTGKPLARWSIPWEKASKLQSIVWTGTCFPFQLDLREVATDRLDASEALISCTFTPSAGAGGGGATVECGSRLTVHVGLTR